jgi:hypothetical protein
MMAVPSSRKSLFNIGFHVHDANLSAGMFSAPKGRPGDSCSFTHSPSLWRSEFRARRTRPPSGDPGATGKAASRSGRPRVRVSGSWLTTTLCITRLTTIRTAPWSGPARCAPSRASSSRTVTAPLNSRVPSIPIIGNPIGRSGRRRSGRHRPGNSRRTPLRHVSSPSRTPNRAGRRLHVRHRRRSHHRRRSSRRGISRS